MQTEPMPKHICCINTYVVLQYFQKAFPKIALESFLEGIVNSDNYVVKDPTDDTAQAISIDYLLDSQNWCSNRLWLALFDNARRLTNDPYIAYKAGRESHNLQKLSLMNIAMRFVDVPTIIRKIPQKNSEFNRNKQIEIVEINPKDAKVRLIFDMDKKPGRDICMFNRGVYESLGRITGTPASVEETACTFDWQPYCEFYITWVERPFIKRMINKARYAIAGDVVEELWNKDLEKTEIILAKEDEIRKALTRERQLHKERESLITRLNEMEKHQFITGLLNRAKHQLNNPLVVLSALVAEIEGSSYEPGNLEKATLDLRDALKKLYKPVETLGTIAKDVSYISRCIGNSELEEAVRQAEQVELLSKHSADTIEKVFKKDIVPGMQSLADAVRIAEEESTKSHLETIKHEVYNIKGVVDAIGMLARAGSYRPGDKAVNLTRLLESYADRYAKRLEEKGVSYSVSGPDCTIRGEEAHIYEIFDNLMNNAIAAIEKKGGPGKITVRTGEKELYLNKPYAIVEIEDTGVGIRAKDKKEIFMLDPSLKHGHGIGLPHVRQILFAYEGKIDYRSEPEKGSTFVVALPKHR